MEIPSGLHIFSVFLYGTFKNAPLPNDQIVDNDIQYRIHGESTNSVQQFQFKPYITDRQMVNR